LEAEAERNPFFSTRDLRAATAFPGLKDAIISRLKEAGQVMACCGEGACH
jgi:magnesium-transporting ATPase (P-type)